jgi:outer membrane lipoprotein carrier protein
MEPGKYSPRRRQATVSLPFATALLGCGFVFCHSAGSQSATPESGPIDGAEALELFLDEANTVQAQFHQELWDAEDRLVETAVGTLSLKRPNRFLWSYREPIEQLVIADGERLWIYDVELAQVTVTPLDEPVAATPAMLLSGDQAVRDGFEILESFDADDLSWVRLVPKLEGTDFRSVLIGFRNGNLARLELVDGLDQVTRIEFSEVLINTELADALFEFLPPDGVDVIGGVATAG